MRLVTISSTVLREHVEWLKLITLQVVLLLLISCSIAASISQKVSG